MKIIEAVKIKHTQATQTQLRNAVKCATFYGNFSPFWQKYENVGHRNYKRNLVVKVTN